MQENWIGKSRGLQFRFRSGARCRGGACGIEVFTTRPDTIFGASFVAAVARPSDRAGAAAAERPAAAEFIAECQRRRHQRGRDRDGGEAGLRHRPRGRPSVRSRMAAAAVHRQFRADGIWHRRASSACPATTSATSSSRANIGLPIQRVVAESPSDAERADRERGRRRRRRRGQFALPRRHAASRQAKAEVIRRAEADGWGEGTTVWRLRDWGVSRQRYWGTPIPIIHCASLRRRSASRATSCRSCCPRTSASTSRAIRSTAIRPGSMSTARAAAARRRARDRHARHLRRFQLVFHPLRQPAGGPAVRPRRGRELAAGRRNISAASSMRSCTCSTPASGPARCSASARSASPSRSAACSRRAW